MTQIDKNTIIADILRAHPDCAEFFFEIGMHCLGCTMAKAETVEQACQAHGEDADMLVERINAFLREQN